jgi:putative Holliday junction resolvase
MFGMRYLAIDLGDKRTGLALGDSELRLATPIEVIQVPIGHDQGRALMGKVAAAALLHLGDPPRSPGEIVVGLPLNMDGSEGPRAMMARRFASHVAQITNRSVHLHDERLTSAAADWSMAMSGLTHKQKKERRDALAAAAMLQSFLDALPRPPRTEP